MASIPELVKSLQSPKKLDRDRGVTQLQNKLAHLDKDEIESLQSVVLTALQEEGSQWEAKQGSLMASKQLLKSQHSTDQFQLDLRDCCVSCLSHEEARVRFEAGEVLGELSKKSGADIYLMIKSMVLKGVKTNLERLPVDGQEQKEAQQLAEKLGAHDKGMMAVYKAEQIFHDTAGWQHLETWMKCLQFVVEGCGAQFLPHIDQGLLDLIFSTLTHTNRFVRETGYYVCAALVGCNDTKDATPGDPPNSVLKHGQQFARHLADGLADNWSQVRLAASVATRQFLSNIKSVDVQKQYYGLLVPRMCLNRYYVAEGVKIYSQETWKSIAGEQGKELVEQHIKEVVDFYIEQSDADNHAVREAACACIAELGSKVDAETVRPHVQRLLEALLVCFQDDSWPVRDAACVACGNFILCFPEESRGCMEKLLPLFYGNLQDNIFSVRQGAAVALGKVARAYGGEIDSKLIAKIRESFDGMEKQESSDNKFVGLENTPATFGVVKSLRDNDVELHSDKQMYSCGSLAPKMGRGREGGCMDHKFRRPSEPWELCDGCIDLMAELSSISQLAQEISKLLPELAEVLKKRDYAQHVVLLETTCLQLPVIGTAIGKRYFKPHLEQFFDAIFYSLSCDNALTNAAASSCLSKLASFLGPNILRGRVEAYDPSLLDKLNSAVPAMPY